MANVRRWWLAASVDAFGTWLLVMALPLEVYRRTGSTTSTALALAMEAAPVVLIGPWAGAAVDRWPHRRVLILANLVAAAAVALMLSGGLGALYGALLIEKAAVCFIQPAMTAMLPALTGDLAAANARLIATTSVFRLVGPPAGTLLAAHDRFAVVVVADAASYLLAALIIATVRVASVAPAGRPRAGLRLVATVPALRGLLLSTFAFWTANAGLTVLLIPFATGRLHSAGPAVGLLIAGLGFGYLCGSVLGKSLVPRYAVGTLLAAAYGVVGGCFLVLFTTSRLPVALAAVTLSGVPGAVAAIAARRSVQMLSPGGALGRVAAAFLVSDAVAALSGALIAPILVAVAGLAAATILLSCLVLVAAAVARVALPAVTPGRAGSARTPG